MVPENHKLARKCTTKPNLALGCTEIPNQKNRFNLYLLWVYHRPYPGGGGGQRGGGDGGGGRGGGWGGGEDGEASG